LTKLEANFLKNVLPTENIAYLSAQLLSASISWQHSIPFVDNKYAKYIGTETLKLQYMQIILS